MSDRCPLTDCTETKRPDDLLCRGHWHQVPKVLRDAVWRWWWALKRKPNDAELKKAHRAAALAAIEAVERIEERRRARAAGA